MGHILSRSSIVATLGLKVKNHNEEMQYDSQIFFLLDECNLLNDN